MNKMAKILRITGGVLLLFNILYLFLPVISAVQENYPTVTYTQIDFLKAAFDKIFQRKTSLRISSTQLIEIVSFIAVPLIISVIFGIISIVAGARQIISGIFSVISGGLNIAFTMKVVTLGNIYKKEYQNIEKCIGLNIILVISILVIIFGILAIIIRQSKKKNVVLTDNYIPNVNEMYQEQLKPKVDYIDEAKLKQEHQQDAQNDMGMSGTDIQNNTDKMNEESDLQGNGNQPRGVMKGLTGMYAGAEIEFKDGEKISFGRDNTNDVIFENAERVSRSHCTITWDREKKEYIILDTSSNGCFVNGMEDCIPQNIPVSLAVGTIIDIGDENNRFILE